MGLISRKPMRVNVLGPIRHMIRLVISRVASYFHEPEASANTAYEWNNRAIFQDECNKWFILYFIFF